MHKYIMAYIIINRIVAQDTLERRIDELTSEINNWDWYEETQMRPVKADWPDWYKWYHTNQRLNRARLTKLKAAYYDAYMSTVEVSTFDSKHMHAIKVMTNLASTLN